jgi:hypothetical protein
MAFSFVCSACGETHQGMPSFGARAPASYFAIPEAERAARCRLGTDDCVIDESTFFVLGCLDIPVHGESEPFSWGVWVSLSRSSYEQWQWTYEAEKRSHIGPFFGWLNATLKPYPDTMNLKTRVHLRDGKLRPFIELEPSDHPLYLEQRDGIPVARVAELYTLIVHESEP